MNSSRFPMLLSNPRHLRAYLVLCAALFAVPLPAQAMGHGGDHAAHDTIIVHHGKVSLGIGQRPAAIHAHVMNKSSTAKRLTAAQSPAFERIELHTHKTSADGMMRMMQVTHYDIAAGDALALVPGGDHLMGFGFTGKAGDMVEINVTFADGSSASFKAEAVMRKKHNMHHGH